MSKRVQRGIPDFSIPSPDLKAAWDRILKLDKLVTKLKEVTITSESHDAITDIIKQMELALRGE